jgi:hypothetical protein
MYQIKSIILITYIIAKVDNLSLSNEYNNNLHFLNIINENKTELSKVTINQFTNNLTSLNKNHINIISNNVTYKSQFENFINIKIQNFFIIEILILTLNILFIIFGIISTIIKKNKLLLINLVNHSILFIIIISVVYNKIQLIEIENIINYKILLSGFNIFLSLISFDLYSIYHLTYMNLTFKSL